MTFQHKNKQDNVVPIKETLLALRNLIDKGNIWYLGLSNKSTLSVCKWIAAAKKYRICNQLVLIQNLYNLHDCCFDGELAKA